MRAPTTITRTVGAVAVAGLLALLLPFTALAKEGGLVTLAAPIPRDAEPGSSLTVTFTVTIPAESGQMVPVTGSPMVLKLVGPDGTTTEGLGAEHGTPGTYTATIRVPSSGISSAVFGIRGTGTAANGTTSIEDLAFDVDGLLFTTTPHVARSTTSSTSGTTTTAAPDFGPAAAAGVALAIVAAGVIVLIGRRRRMGYA